MSEEYIYIPLLEPESVRGRTGIKCGGGYQYHAPIFLSCHVPIFLSCPTKKKKKGTKKKKRKKKKKLQKKKVP